MKFLTRVSAVLLVTLYIFFNVACSGVKIDIVGNPSSERFKKGHVAKCVWDLKVWNGVLYVGSGDYDSNTGPTDIFCYNIKKKQWSSAGEIKEEAVTRFEVVGNDLIIPGVDSTESWDLGSYYKLENNEWKQHRILPHAVHTFDIVRYNENLMVGIGGDRGYTPALISKDGGQTFEFVQFYKNGEIYDLSQYDFSRTYELFTFKEKLYSLVYHKLIGNGAILELYEYKDDGFYYIRNANELWGAGPSVNVWGAKGEFNNSFYYCSDYLHFSNDAINYNKIELPNDELVSQFRIYNKKMYILSYDLLENDSNKFYNMKIYETEKGTEDFIQLCSFEFEVPPISFDMCDSTFFVGFGNKKEANEKNGTIIKIKI